MRDSELRECYLSGVAVSGPWWLLTLEAAIAALFALAAVMPLFRGMDCLFGWNPGPVYAAKCGGGLHLRLEALALPFLLFAAHVYLHRLFLGRIRFYTAWSGARLTYSHGVLWLGGSALAILEALRFDRAVTEFEWLLIFLAGPAVYVVANGAHAGWARLYARKRPDEAVGLAIERFAAEKCAIRDPNLLHAAVAGRFAAIRGPFDEVDERRIEDAVNSRFHEYVGEIRIESTLPEEARSVGSELGPSGYVSPPIPKPREFPLWVIAALLLIGVGVFVLLLAFGGIYSLEDQARDIEEALGGMGFR